jgi:hypothetical protein
MLVVACSGNETAPLPGPTGIQFVAGNGQTDTIGATLAQALTVRVVSAHHQPGKHEIVQFIAVPGSQGHGDEADIEPIGNLGLTNFVAETTDASGETSVVVVLGAQAGPTHIVVRVPELGFVDTAVFSAQPGNAAGVTISPTDTLVYLDSSLTYSGAAVDRFGNRRADQVTYSIAGGSATVSGARVTGAGFGPAAVVASSGTHSDTARLGVIPMGTLAASVQGGMVIFNLNGSDFVQLPVTAGALKWTASGTQLVFDKTMNGEADGQPLILVTDLSGNVTTIDHSDGFADQWPQVSRDGVWVYFSRIGGPGSANWRTHLDGSGADSLLSQMPDFDIFATPSSDGQHVAYVAAHDETTDLRVATLATGAVTSLKVNAWSPTWSPTSDLIAYLAGASDPARIAVIHADGTGARTLGTAVYNTNIDWSPDGQWVVAHNAATGKIDVLNVASGAAIPLTFTGSEFSPTWKPK